MSKWVDKRGPIEASTLYSDGVLAACDVTMNLPAAEFMTAEVKAMGTMDIPLDALENMEMTITKIGIDKNSTRLTSPGKKNLEARWVQDVIKSDGSTTKEGCKAFLVALPVTLMPEGALEIGSTSEGEIKYTITRYRLVVNGEEILLVDRLAHIIRVNGKDYSRSYDRLL